MRQVLILWPLLVQQNLTTRWGHGVWKKPLAMWCDGAFLSINHVAAILNHMVAIGHGVFMFSRCWESCESHVNNVGSKQRVHFSTGVKSTSVNHKVHVLCCCVEGKSLTVNKKQWWRQESCNESSSSDSSKTFIFFPMNKRLNNLFKELRHFIVS